MGLSLVNTQNPDVFNDTTLPLNVPFSIETIQVGTRSFLYVSAVTIDRLSAYEIATNGSLTALQVFNDSDDPTYELDRINYIHPMEINGEPFLVASGRDDDGITIFRVNNDGTLEITQIVPDAGLYELDGAIDMTSVEIGGTTYLYVAGLDDHGISVFAMNDNGTINSNVQNIGDSPTLNILFPFYMETVEIGGTHFVISGGTTDEGFSVFRVNFDGTLTNTDNVRDSENAAYLMNGQYSLSVAQTSAGTFLYAGGLNDNGLSIFELHPNGTLSHIGPVADTTGLNLGMIWRSSTFEVNGTSYLSVVSQSESGFSLFRVEEDGMLTELDSVNHAAPRNLLATTSSTFVVLDNIPHLIVSGFNSNGVSVFRMDMPLQASYNGNLFGTGETIAGLLENAPGGTRIEMVAPMDYDVSRESVSVTQDNIRLELGDTGAQLDFHLDDFAFNFTTSGDGAVRVIGSGINSENIRTGYGDDVIFGAAGNDTLNSNRGDDLVKAGHGNDLVMLDSGTDTGFGGQGADTIHGEGGNDSLHGGRSDDSLTGGTGNDTLLGERGKDILVGGTGNDFIFGASGDDSIFGGDGADQLFGGEGNDSLTGDANSDLIDGGEGADLLDGGSASDTLAGGAGADTLNGDTGNDYVAGGSGKDRLLGGSGADTLLGDSGNDTLDAGDGNDQLRGGTGNDRLTGGAGSDDFVFEIGDGTDRVLDFEDDVDQIDLDLVALGFASVTQLVSLVGTQNGANAVLDFGVDGVIIIENTQLGDLINDII